MYQYGGKAWVFHAVVSWPPQVSSRLAEHVGWSEVPDQA